MIHGQFFGGGLAAAVMTTALGAATFPPLRRPEITGFVAFPFDIRIVYGVGIGIHKLFAITGPPPNQVDSATF